MRCSSQDGRIRRLHMYPRAWNHLTVSLALARRFDISSNVDLLSHATVAMLTGLSRFYETCLYAEHVGPEQAQPSFLRFSLLALLEEMQTSHMSAVPWH